MVCRYGDKDDHCMDGWKCGQNLKMLWDSDGTHGNEGIDVSLCSSQSYLAYYNWLVND